MTAETTGIFNYLPSEQPDAGPETEQRARLASMAAVEPILKRWRHRCPAGLIDESNCGGFVCVKRLYPESHHQKNERRERNEPTGDAEHRNVPSAFVFAG